MTDARTIQGLKVKRRHVSSAPWTLIACQVWHDITDVIDPDADLMMAIEALRQHQLAKVDAQLAEFGMEPPLPKPRSRRPIAS